jgi:hypothetical protein
METRRLPTLIMLQDRKPSAGGSPKKDPVREQPPVDARYWLEEEGKIYPLKVGVNMLGRLADNDVVIQGPHVSRRHCFLVVQIGLPCELHDSGSRNGTYVNGLKVSSSTKLFTGDEIWICRRRFVFRSKADHLG